MSTPRIASGAEPDLLPSGLARPERISRRTNGPVILWLAALAAVALPAAAEEGPAQHSLQVGLGPALFQVSDAIVRGMRWDGPGLGIDAAYRRTGDAGRHEVALRLGLSYLTNSYGYQAAAFSNHVGYGYLRRTADFGRWGVLFLGGQARQDVDLPYYFKWDEEHAYWLTSLTLAVAARLEMAAAPSHQLALGVALPLGGWVARPAEFRYYKTDDLSGVGWLFARPYDGLALATLNHYQALHLEAAYTYAPGGRWSLRAVWALDYRHAVLPRTVQVFANAVKVGFGYAL